jgi:signal transduction histidine kinase
VKQIVLNLLTNAVKFTPEGGRVTLSAIRSDGAYELSVRDTGLGIAEEDLGRIFESSSKSARTAPARPRAPGSASRSRAAWSSCTADDPRVERSRHGSTFTFTLPIGLQAP